MKSAAPQIVASLLAVVLMAPATAQAETPRDAALGLAGEVYLVHAGACGEVLDACAGGAEEYPVLALEVVRAGASTRLAVPETDGVESEGAPALVYEDSSESVFLVWESRQEAGPSRVNLVWFDGEGFSEVIEISGDISPLKGPPQVVLTRDSYGIDGAAGEAAEVRRQRTILHVAWWEEGPEREEVYYTPIVLEDGAYIGHNRVFNLSQRDPTLIPASAATLPAPLHRSPRIEPGRSEASAVVGFANPASGRFLVFEVQVLPHELSDLGDRIRAHMIEIGHRYRPASLPAFAARIRAHMIEIGYRLHPAILTYLADRVASEILGARPAHEPVRDLADRIRAHMIEIGARALGAGGVAAMPMSGPSEVLETRPGAPGGAQVPHQVWLRLVSDRPAPEVAERPVWIFLSEDGRQAVVGWEDGFADEGELRYRETEGDGWSEMRRVPMIGLIDAARAERILRQRVRER